MKRSDMRYLPVFIALLLLSGSLALFISNGSSGDDHLIAVQLNDIGSVTRNLIAPANETPVAESGPDVSTDQGSAVQFNGSGSTDDGDMVNYTWTFNDTGDVILEGIAPQYTFLDAGLFVITLNVTDDEGLWDTDIMNVTVNDTKPPVADAGENVTVDEGSAVTLNGTGSTDNVGIENYTWTFYDSVEVFLYGPEPVYTFENPGVFSIMLNVTDGADNWDTDTVNITVRDTTEPVAMAGPDREIYPGDKVVFNASGSMDNVGIINFTWSFGYNGSKLFYTSVFEFVFDLAGTYTITLNVTDAGGNWALDTAVVTVLNTSEPRAVIAAVPGTVAVNGSITFDASGSQPGVDSVLESYGWHLSRFGTPIWNLTGDIVNYKFTEWGIYEMSLTITDSANRTDAMSVLILAGDLVNFTDLSAELPGVDPVTVEFGQFIEDHYSGIVRVTWRIQYPDGDNISERTMTVEPSEFDTVAQNYSKTGEYNITLEIETGYGVFEQNEKLTILEEGALNNTPPIIIIGYPPAPVVSGKEFILDASETTDPDGDNMSFRWTRTYGNDTFAIDPSANSPVSQPPGMKMFLTLDKVGVHFFRLTVTDSRGASNSTEINVTVEKDTTDFTPAGHPDSWSPQKWREWNDTWYPNYVDPRKDMDRDGIANYNDPDIDGDGFWDQEELNAGTDPTDPDSKPGKKESKDTNCTMLIVLVVIFVVILILMIAIFTRGRGGSKPGYRPKNEGKDFF